MTPSLVSRTAFFAAMACPFCLRISRALSISPPASDNALLQSIIPAPVFSRRSFTISCVTAGMLRPPQRRSFELPIPLYRPLTRQQPASQPLLPALDNHIRDPGTDQFNGLDGIIIAGDYKINIFRVTVGINDPHDRNPKLVCLMDCNELFFGIHDK